MSYTATMRKAKDKISLVFMGVTMMYVKHTGFGTLKYGEEVVKGQPHMNHQYECDVLITPEMAKALKAVNKKASIKTFTAKQFKETFKIDPPYEGSKYLTTKLYKEAYFKEGHAQAGEVSLKPKVLDSGKEPMGDTEVGNGSVGNIVVHVKPYDNKWGVGNTVRLGAIQVTSLVEFIGNDAADEFDVEDDEQSSEFDTDTSDTKDEWED